MEYGILNKTRLRQEWIAAPKVYLEVRQALMCDIGTMALHLGVSWDGIRESAVAIMSHSGSHENALEAYLGLVTKSTENNLC